MKTLEEVRKDLKDIRYYYRRKHLFDEVTDSVGECRFCEKVRKYNAAAKYAPPAMYDVYVCLYIKNFTQESLAAELNYTTDHVQKINKKLLVFLQHNVNE